MGAVAADGFGTLARPNSEAAAEHRRGTLEAISAIGREYVAFAQAEPELFRLMFARAPDGAAAVGASGPRSAGRAPCAGRDEDTGGRDATGEDDPERDERASAGETAYGVLIAEVAAHLERPPGDPAVLRTAMALWTLVHGLSCLLIDGMTDVARIDLDGESMLRAAGGSLLGAFAD